MLRPKWCKEGQVSSNFQSLSYQAIAELSDQWLLPEKILPHVTTFLFKDSGKVNFKVMVI